MELIDATLNLKYLVSNKHYIVFSDCVANVDSRAESIDKKIVRLDAELRKYKVSRPL